MKPEISIIMPVRNGERYIGEAIESILAQTYKNYELIVVDDGCTDRTCELVEGFRPRLDLKWVHHPCQPGNRAFRQRRPAGCFGEVHRVSGP